MSKLLRKTFLQFGSTVNPASEIGQFGSYASPVYSNDPDVLQSGTAWPRGWVAETIATNRPFLEDFNAIDFVFSYMIATILQMGVSEYDIATTYYKNSIVQDTSGQLYVSTQDNNTGNTPSSSPLFWQPGLPSAEITGVIKQYAGAAAPSSYLICDGSAISRVSFANLFNVIGTTYGIGDGATTFNIPDLRQRVPVGFKSGDPNFGALGNFGGEVTHQLTIPEIPAHTHQTDMYKGEGEGGAIRYSSAFAANFVGTLNTGSVGGNVPHNNLQPFVTLNYIIKT